jgi:hypothetical protein
LGKWEANWTDAFDLWRNFCSRETAWLGRVDLSEPVYCLPELAIEELMRPLSGKRRVVDESAAVAERHLLRICESENAVGFWQGRPIAYPYLFSCTRGTAGVQELLGDMPEAEKRLYLTALRAADEKGTHQQLAGVVGCLCVDPIYQNEVKALAQQWNRLPPNEKPSFPLTRPIRGHAIPVDDKPISPACFCFIEQLTDFLDRWELMQLVTWDLPLPQGPLTPNPLPIGSPAIPTQGIQNIIPSHCPIQLGDDLNRVVKTGQQQIVAEKGISVSLAGVAHHAAYGRMLKVNHLESTIVKRYLRGRRPKGFMTRVEMAIAAALERGIDNVKKLRKAISLCRRGKRASVTWLQPPTR